MHSLVSEGREANVFIFRLVMTSRYSCRKELINDDMKGYSIFSMACGLIYGYGQWLW